MFDHIRDAFRYRNEYAREIRLASDTGWFLVRSGHRFGDVRSLNRRIAWCTRTILIATAAEQRRAIFSASGLGEFSGSTAVPELIRNKDNVDMDARIIEMFRDVLSTWHRGTAADRTGGRAAASVRARPEHVRMSAVPRDHERHGFRLNVRCTWG